MGTTATTTLNVSPFRATFHAFGRESSGRSIKFLSSTWSCVFNFPQTPSRGELLGPKSCRQEIGKPYSFALSGGRPTEF